jgi:ferrochelatase
LASRGVDAKVFIAMRAWHPRSDEAARGVAEYGPDCTVLVPLYPQFSTTTTASSLDDWRKSVALTRGCGKERRVCCYPWDNGFVTAVAQQLCAVLDDRKAELAYRILFSAHGLPQRTVAGGDPYQWQIQATAAAVVHKLAMEDQDWKICYQSRVGPQKWLAPTTDSELVRAGADGLGVIVVPISFVSEHSETLVELDIDYAKLAAESGVPHYLRVATVRTNPQFMDGVAELVIRAAASEQPVTCGSGRICPARFARCGMEEAA